MKISLEWLNDYLPGPLNAAELGNALTHGGLPVEVFEKHGDDDVIDVEVTSNRPDCLSHVGVARELAALLDRPFIEVRPTATESEPATMDSVDVTISSPDCPHYVARVIRNVKIAPSPAWMQRRLQAIGVRPINNVVDVTNYVMFELGQPLHAFDLDRIAGQQIVVRHARLGETLTSIDGHDRKLAPDMLVIADSSKPLALAGVMGGRESEVSDRTINILLESARFDPLSIRKTARTLAMKSDSSYRFERGLDLTLPELASLRAAELILQTVGGTLLSGSVIAGASGHRPRSLSIRLATLQRVLGVAIPAADAVMALTRLGLAPVQQGDRIDVIVPSHRLDINIEVDLVEEIARIIGYDRIPLRDQIEIRLTPADPSAQAFAKVRESLIGAGYFEAITYTFVSDLLAGDFLPTPATRLPRVDARVRKDNAHLRPSLLPGLLEAVRRNETSGNGAQKFFETGSIFHYDPSLSLQERRSLGLVGSADLREVRGAIEVMLAKLDKDRKVEVVPDAYPGLSPGATGRIVWGGVTVGSIGKVDPSICTKLSLIHHPVAAELDLTMLLSGARPVPEVKSLPRFPEMRRDLSLVVGEQTRYIDVEQAIASTNTTHLERVSYVTTYRGKPLEKGVKSITLTLTFRSEEGTLTSEQVESSIAAIVASCQAKLGATLRT